MDREQQGRFKEALDKKNQEAEQKARDTSLADHAEDTITDPGSQDESSVRAKNSRKGQVTADKWNQ